MPTQLVTSPGSLQGNDFIDWGAVAPSGSSLVFGPDHTFHGQTHGGRSFRIVHPTSIDRLTQGGANATWTGNFAPGDEVIYTLGDIGPLVLVFEQAVRAAGAQIQVNATPLRFRAFLRVFDAGGALLGEHRRDGRSTDRNNNSAIFLGVSSSPARFNRIEFRTVSLDPPAKVSLDFAINRLDLRV